MLITIAIPAFDEEKLLAATLTAVTEAGDAFSERNWEMEVVVCDNNSTDRTAEIAEAGGARVVFEKHNQISRARNAAGKAAKGEWIIFLDADSEPSKELFEATAAAMEKKEVIGGGTTIKYDVQNWVVTIITVAWNAISRVMHWPAGSYIFLRTEDFHELNGFSDKLYASEELEFGGRLKKLAQQRNQHLQILTQTPLATSPRRFRLMRSYPLLENLKFILKHSFSMVFTGGRSLQKAENCRFWYDGRR